MTKYIKIHYEEGEGGGASRNNEENIK